MSLILPTLCFILHLTLSLCADGISNDTEMLNNSSQLKKDMYVVHALVYQVGIITNKTDNDTGNFNSTGEEEALTFFHTNGSKVDLSKIPKPLLTNVTAESLVGLAPSSSFEKLKLNSSTWTNKNPHRYIRSSGFHKEIKVTKHLYNTNKMSKKIMDADKFKTFSKRNTDSNENTPVKIIKGSAVIPKDAGIQTLAIPPLLSLSNNLTNIPVPIPNTSVVQYAKINALVHMP